MGIKLQRQKTGISQEELAEKVGVTQGMVSQWETGEYKPRANKLLILADALNCSVDDLLKD